MSPTAVARLLALADADLDARGAPVLATVEEWLTAQTAAEPGPPM